MPITSNYSVNLRPLQAEELGVLPQSTTTSKRSPWISILGWVATIAEIGVSLLLPETAPIWASLAISTTGAGVQTGLMAASGEVSAVGLGLNWAAALIPFGAQGAKLAAKEAKITNLAKLLEIDKTLVKEGLGGNQIAQGLKNFSDFIKDTAVAPQTLEKALMGAENEFEKFIFRKGIKEAEDIINKLGASSLKIEGFEFPSFEFALDAAKKMRETIIDIERNIARAIQAPTTEAIAAEIGEELSQEFTGADATEIRNLLTKVFGKEVDDLYKILEISPKHTHNSIIKAFILEKLGKDKANALLERIFQIYDKPKKAMLKAQKSVKNNSALSKAIRYAGTRKFDEKVVQRVQAIFDASDFGRKWIEDSYKLLKKQLRKAFARSAKVLDKLEDLEEAYLKSGGHLVAGSEIIGYKVLKTVGHKSLIMINFNPAKWDMGGTAAKNRIWKGRFTKNFGGKKPVFVWARIDEMARLVNEGMEYYLEKWAYSRGGLVVGTNLFNNIFRGMDITVLPFVKTGLLRNLLSLTSNIVENTYDMANGNWHREWVNKAWRSFKRTGVSRVGRLFAQGVVRPAIGGRVGYYIGREVQRVLGATSTAINDNLIDHKSTFGKKWIASYKGKFMGGAISYLNAPARQKGLYAANKRTAQRKLGFLRRPVSAITPDAVLSPRKIGLIIKV